MESGITTNQLIATLTKSPHGDLAQYLPIGLPAAEKDPEFFGKLLGWNAKKGEIRDSKKALPVIALAVAADPELQENALAYLAMLPPRELKLAIEFAKIVHKSRRSFSLRMVKRLVGRYLVDLEAHTGVWDRRALQHKQTLTWLYRFSHTSPSSRAQVILFRGGNGKHGGTRLPFLLPRGSVWEALVQLKTATAIMAAGLIAKFRIPFLILQGVLGAKAKDPDLGLAMINNMTPAEVIKNTKMLEKLGIKSVPALRAAYQEKLTAAAESRKGASLAASKAAEVLSEDEDNAPLVAKLQAVAEKKLEMISVEGNWLVLADKSASMQTAIEKAREVAAVLAKVAKGSVYLAFFDTSVRGYEVTGKTLDEITKLTRLIKADGGTSCGAGIDWAQSNNYEVDGIVIISDGGENNHPYFAPAYEAYVKQLGRTLPVYYYRVSAAGWGVGSSFNADAMTGNLKRSNIAVTTFDVDKSMDYYSMPNLVQTMRTNRYSLTDEIMSFPLLKLDDVLTRTKTVESVAV